MTDYKEISAREAQALAAEKRAGLTPRVDFLRDEYQNENGEHIVRVYSGDVSFSENFAVEADSVLVDGNLRVGGLLSDCDEADSTLLVVLGNVAARDLHSSGEMIIGGDVVASHALAHLRVTGTFIGLLTLLSACTAPPATQTPKPMHHGSRAAPAMLADTGDEPADTDEGQAPDETRTHCDVMDHSSANLGGKGASPISAEIVESWEEIRGASRHWNVRKLAINVGRVTVMETDHDELSSSCQQGALVLQWQGGANEKASLELAAANGTLVVAPGLADRLDRAWTQDDPQDLAALHSIIASLPPSLAPTIEIIAAARIVAARQALTLQNFTLTELMLMDLAELPDGSVWGPRLRSLSLELERTRMRTQPIQAGKPISMGTTKFVPTAPALPSPTVFWSGGKACLAQEENGSPGKMKCLNAKTLRWGPLEPFQIVYPENGELEITGGGNPCDYVDSCWLKTDLASQESVCDGVECNSILAVVPGPRIIVQGEGGLFAVDSLKTPARLLAAGVSGKEIAQLPGSALAGGHFYFSGPLLIDGRRTGRSWKLFRNPIGDVVHTVLVSPNLKWAVVASQVSGDRPVALWLVPLKRR